MAHKSPRVAALKAELETKKAELLARLAPARELHDKHVNDPAYLAARKTIKEVNAELAPIENELAQLARAGGARRIKAEPGELGIKKGG